MSGKKTLTGKWRVVELPDLSEDYIHLTPDPHVLLKVSKTGEVDGTYQFGVQSGELDGKVEVAENGASRITFTFEGNDEMDPVHGFGIATLTAPDTLTGEMRYHKSDTCRFTWKRK
ncbi:MAG: hypothetical protein AB1476_04855 [Candidatus Hadarchaeota archaeon]